MPFILLLKILLNGAPAPRKLSLCQRVSFICSSGNENSVLAAAAVAFFACNWQSQSVRLSMQYLLWKRLRQDYLANACLWLTCGSAAPLVALSNYWRGVSQREFCNNLNCCRTLYYFHFIAFAACHLPLHAFLLLAFERTFLLRHFFLLFCCLLPLQFVVLLWALLTLFLPNLAQCSASYICLHFAQKRNANIVIVSLQE